VLFLILFFYILFYFFVEYLGCYVDSGYRDLTGDMYYDQQLNPSKCSSFCGLNGYRYAGMEREKREREEQREEGGETRELG
jgi:hypothetical protein